MSSSSAACTTLCTTPENYGQKIYRVFFGFISAALAFVGGLVTNAMIVSIVDLVMFELGIYYNSEGVLDNGPNTEKKLKNLAQAKAVTFVVVVVICIGLIILLEYINSLVMAS